MASNRQRGSKHEIPASAHTVRDYATMKLLAQKFASGKIPLLIVLGSPGKGKGQIVKRAMQEQQPTTHDEWMAVLDKSIGEILARLAEPTADGDPPNANAQQNAPVKLGPGLYVKGYIRPIVFHIRAYKHRGAPICIDDADVFFGDVQLREQTKHLSETDKYKLLAHSSLSKELIAQDVPQEFWTTSPVCIIRNTWDGSDPINQAIESRGLFIVFAPPWDEVYKYIGEWFWDQEIYDYLLEKMPLLRDPDVRIVVRASDMKNAEVPGMPWQSVIDQHVADQSHLLMAEFLSRDEADFGGKEQRIDAWSAAVKAKDPNASSSRATWHRYKKEVEQLLAKPRPNRIILERNTRPEERRPFDSPIGGRDDDHDHDG